MARRDALGRVLLYAACAPVLVFLLLPSLVIVPMALTKGQMLQFPPVWISVHAFTDYLGDPQWFASTVLSFQVAALAVAIGCLTGSAAAVALHGRGFPGKGLLTGAIMAPIVVPLVVFALGGYLVFARLHMAGDWVAIGLLHGMLVTPYVFISVQTSLLAALNPLLVRSARSLGAGRLSVLRHVVWPAIRPGVLAGAVLGFAVSFDEVVVALFLQGPQTVTLPVRMFTAIQFELTPKVAASASLFLALSVLVLLAQYIRDAPAGGGMNVALPIVAGMPHPAGPHPDGPHPAGPLWDGLQPDGSAPDRSSAGTRHHLEVDRVWKSYTAGIHVVRDVSFTLGQGEFLTLLGPSGSGKTSTLMMVAGFEAPTRGAIRVDGRDVAQLPPERRNFGVVFQGYALFPHMTVLDNVAFPLRMKRVGAAARRRAAMAMLDRVGLAEFAARRPRALSGGQQQRVALARALVFEPDALLLDEPLGALDRKLREALQVEIKDLQRRVGVSILFVTHDQDEAMMMSDRIAVMQDGRIVQLGAPDEVYLHPETPFVAGFLGETNLLRAVCVGQQDGHAVVRFADRVTGPARLSRGGARPGVGEPVLASVRPERISLLAPDATAACVVEGVVTDRVFLGRHTRLTVQVLGRTLVVSAAEPPPAAVARGAAVRLGWSREDAQILNETVEATA